MSEKEIVFCKSGGCTAKLGAGVLEHILERLPKGKKDENLLVGYDSKDDAAVYRLNEHQAVVQTLDFFPPMVEDPYIFGKIAATNALSDIYAMGGEVKTALNIVCFPESMDLNILGKILQGPPCPPCLPKSGKGPCRRCGRSQTAGRTGCLPCCGAGRRPPGPPSCHAGPGSASDSWTDSSCPPKRGSW